VPRRKTMSTSICGTNLPPRHRGGPAASYQLAEAHRDALLDRCSPTLRTLHRILICFAVLATAGVSPCAAQRLRPVSFDFNVGASVGASSAPHESSGGISADALLGFQRGARAAGGLVVAVGVSGQALGVHAACDVVPGGTCAPDFPGFGILSTLAGWETANGGARFLVGPAVAMSGSKLVGATQARLDLAKPIFSHFSLLVAGGFAYIPKYRGDSFSLGSIGVGFRLR
jgi:hypothetical protein